MNLDAEIDYKKRLILIRYLHRLDVEQSRQQGVRSAISILMFHDAVDLWLQLAAARLDVPTKGEKTYFYQYLSMIEEKLAKEGRQLLHMHPMKQLNSARNALKHSGTLPNADSIASFRVHIGDFLQDNTIEVFVRISSNCRSSIW